MVFIFLPILHYLFRHIQMQIGQVIPLIVDLLQDIVFFWVILLSLREARNKQSLLVPTLKQNIEHEQLLQLNLFGYVGYYRILVLTIPLQLNFTVIIEVLFKLLIINDVFHECTKHIDIDCHFIRHHLLQGTLTLQSVSSQDQLVDIFTKPLPPGTFRTLASKLRMISLKPP